MQPLKVLLVEDSPADAELLTHELRHTGYVLNAVRVDTEADFRAQLTPQVDVILADYSMPQFNAFRALEILQESGLDIPFLIVSGQIGEDQAIEALRKGADDYLLKDRLARLGQAVAHALRAHSLRREKSAAVEQLRLQSAALMAAANAIVITNDQGIILWVNPAFEKLTGYDLPDTVGRPLRFLKAEEKDELIYDKIWATLHAGRVWQGELIHRKKDGTLYQEEMTITPVLNKAGVITHYVAIKQDITERKLIQETLFQAQKMDSIGTLAGGIAHDFNNLIVVILGFAELALANLDIPGEARPDILEIKAAAERAAELTRQLMAFSRKQPLSTRTLNLNELITGMEGMLRRLLGEDIRLTDAFDPQAGLINADPGQIEQVVMNLVINARDAMPGGGEVILGTSVESLVETDVSGWPGAQAGPHTCLSVTDKGGGMRKEVLDHIFEPFFTTKAEGKGTGLGLSVVYGVVTQHRGCIRVISQPGKGTTFKVCLPVCAAPSNEAQEQKPEALSLRQGKGQPILLVEDDAGVRHFAERLLVRAGYQAVVASDGQEALKVYAQQTPPPSLLFTDTILPALNGLELATRLCAIQPSLKVLITTGHSNEKVQSGLPMGPGWRMLPKPYTAGELLKAVNDLLHPSSPKRV